MRALFDKILGSGMSASERDLLETCERALQASYDTAMTIGNWAAAAGHVGQHVGDVHADDAALEVLSGAGYYVLSEESGFTGAESDLVLVIDPVDGSSNVARGIPYWCSSIGIIDKEGIAGGMVLAMPYGDLYWAMRGCGAYLNDRRLPSGEDRKFGESIVFLNGYAPAYLGWSQYRAMGSAALELCMVASGVADAFIDFSRRGLAIWDYAGALALCIESGCVLKDMAGRDLLALGTDTRRNVVAARSKVLHQEICELIAPYVDNHQ